jgi:hypothetical protein
LSRLRLKTIKDHVMDSIELYGYDRTPKKSLRSRKRSKSRIIFSSKRSLRLQRKSSQSLLHAKLILGVAEQIKYDTADNFRSIRIHEPKYSWLEPQKDIIEFVTNTNQKLHQNLSSNYSQSSLCNQKLTVVSKNYSSITSLIKSYRRDKV